MSGKLDYLSIKYFKLAIDASSIKKDTNYEISSNCPLCNDRKHRLHLYRPKGFNQDVVHCFNDGCTLSEKHHNMINFLKLVKPEIINAYKREKFQDTVNAIKSNSNSTNTDLNIKDIIEKNTGILNSKEQTQQKTDLKLPLDKLFQKCKDSKECTLYCQLRGFEPKDDWYYSTDKFFTINEKTVFLENFLIIPIYFDGKYKGFYSRSIKEKKFSTFLLPGIEKIWVSSPNVISKNIEIITEGVFDAISSGFEKSGAMLSASLSEEYLMELNKDCIIALDNDKTGIQKSIKFIEKGFKVFIPPDNWKYKDFNEAVQSGINLEKIKKIILNNSYSGILGLTKLKMIEM